MMTVDVLQSLVNATTKDKVATANITRINTTLYQSLTQAQEAILVLSKQLKTLQAQIKTEKPETKKKHYRNKSNIYCWTHIRTRSLDHAIQTCRFPKK